jgi:hypothetical protein
MADLYDSYTSPGDPGGGRDATKFYAFDAKQHADAINANTHAQTLYGARSALPTAATGNTGALYICTDCDAEYQSNGSAWTKIRCGGKGGTLADPPSSGWSDINLVGADAFTSDRDALLLTAASVSGTSWRMRVRTLTPSSSYTAPFYLEPSFQISASAWNSGIILRNSTSGKFIVFFGGYNSGAGGYYMGAEKYDSATAFNSSYKNTGTQVLPSWLRIRDDGTTRYCETSINNTDWNTFHPVGRTDFITPDQIGFGAYNNGTTLPGYVRLRSLTGIS